MNTDTNKKNVCTEDKPLGPNPSNPTCSHCPQAHACRDVWASPNKGPLSPFGLVLAAAVAFLLPCLTAIALGAIAQAYFDTDSNTPTILGALLGLALGALIAAVIVPRVKAKFPHKPSS